MSEPTATETGGMYVYTSPDLDPPIDLFLPLIMPDRIREATLATWGQIVHVPEPIYYEVDVSRKFQQLVNRWSEDTINMSSIAAKIAHPSYLGIISMGETAIPLLLRELEEKPNHWFPALTAITGENPIPEEARGRVKEMTEAWLEWGRNNNYC